MPSWYCDKCLHFIQTYLIISVLFIFIIDTGLEISDNCLKLSAWGIPNTVLAKYKELGITTMFQWQAECLCTGNVLSE